MAKFRSFTVSQSTAVPRDVVLNKLTSILSPVRPVYLLLRMSQQFLSKYFKPAGELSKEKAGKGKNDIPPVNRASKQAEAAASTTQVCS